MSIEAHDLMGEDWTRWQGHVVNGLYPLGRPLGNSDTSGVFMTRAPTLGHDPLAIKLIPVSQEHAETQLDRWARTASLRHPNLLSLLESGSCQLDGLPYLYVVTEYADQTLQQLLLRRTLAAEEAREMLLPMLDALTFLHGQGMVQGALKPANVLVVGDQLKLASDTVRLAGESPLTFGASSPLDEGTAGDIWGLGVSLYEALTRRSAPTHRGRRDSVVLPADFSQEFREIVTGCLRPEPADRPRVMELVGWMKGQPLHQGRDTLDAPSPKQQVQTAPPHAASPPTVPSTVPQDATTPPVRVRSTITRPVTGGLIAVVLVAIFARWIGGHASKPPQAPDAKVSAESAMQSVITTAPITTQPRTPDPVSSAAYSNRRDESPVLALHEVIPTVSQSAARTIHGHVRVSVRAMIAADGSVLRVTADPAARSRYFQQLATKAAKRWTFVPVPAGAPREIQIQFDFTRDGVSAHAISAS